MGAPTLTPSDQALGMRRLRRERALGGYCPQCPQQYHRKRVEGKSMCQLCLDDLKQRSADRRMAAKT